MRGREGPGRLARNRMIHGRWLTEVDGLLRENNERRDAEEPQRREDFFRAVGLDGFFRIATGARSSSSRGCPASAAS